MTVCGMPWAKLAGPAILPMTTAPKTRSFLKKVDTFGPGAVQVGDVVQKEDVVNVLVLFKDSAA